MFQTKNDCGPASVAMILRYFGKQVTQKQVAEVLRPNREDKSVRPDEIVQYARQAGFGAKYLVDGDVRTITALVSAGFPVMVRQWLKEDSDIAHFRIVVGYRGSGKMLICDDSYRGQWISCSKEEFEKLWEPFLFEYIVVYPPSREKTVAAIVGDHWNEDLMKKAALEHASIAVKERPEDAFAWYNLGRAYFLEGKMPEAASAFEKALELGLPKRFFWYQYEALWAFNRTGRYREVLEISSKVIEQAPSIAEVHLARGDALLGLGQKEEAIAEYRLALKYQPTLSQAKTRLFSLGACNPHHNRW